MDAVVQQLSDYCDCIKDLNKDGLVLQQNVEELIQLVSIATCWTREPCETFLNSSRTEVIKVGDIDKCKCNGGLVVFEPYYYPFNADSFEVTLVKIDGVREELIPIDSEDFGYILSEEHLRIDLKSYVTQDKCSCESEFRLIITYDAGFETIPDCLLKVFCDLLHIIFDKNKCTCEACQACKAGGTDVIIEFDENEVISITPKIQNYLTNFLFEAYAKQLSLISICGRDAKTTELWGFVI